MRIDVARLMPSTHVYGAFEALNRSAARAVYDAFEAPPTGGFLDRVLFDTKTILPQMFLYTANGLGAAPAQALVAFTGIREFAIVGGASVGLAACSNLMYAGLAAAVICVVGVGPRASMLTRAAGEEIATPELLLEHGLLGVLSPLMYRVAQEQAQHRRTVCACAASACAFAITVGLEPLRLAVACVTFAACMATLGVLCVFLLPIASFCIPLKHAGEDMSVPYAPTDDFGYAAAILGRPPLLSSHTPYERDPSAYTRARIILNR